MPKVYVVGESVNYARFIKNAELVNKLDDADIVLFTGGEDVTPSIYGCKKHATTSNNYSRDRREMSVFKKIRLDQLVVGICRGLNCGSR